MTSQLNRLSLGATFISSISSSTQNLSITASSSDFSITSNDENYKYLGLDQNTTKSSSSSVYTSSNVVDLAGTRYIDLLIDLPLASNNNRNMNKNLLARVWRNADSFNTIFYNNNNFNFVKLLTTSFNGLRIRLQDEFGDLLNTNGVDWDCVIEFKLADK